MNIKVKRFSVFGKPMILRKAEEIDPERKCWDTKLYYKVADKLSGKKSQPKEFSDLSPMEQLYLWDNRYHNTPYKSAYRDELNGDFKSGLRKRQNIRGSATAVGLGAAGLGAGHLISKKLLGGGHYKKLLGAGLVTGAVLGDSFGRKAAIRDQRNLHRRLNNNPEFRRRFEASL